MRSSVLCFFILTVHAQHGSMLCDARMCVSVLMCRAASLGYSMLNAHEASAVGTCETGQLRHPLLSPNDAYNPSIISIEHSPQRCAQSYVNSLLNFVVSRR